MQAIKKRPLSTGQLYLALKVDFQIGVLPLLYFLKKKKKEGKQQQKEKQIIQKNLCFITDTITQHLKKNGKS